ncbi:MAG TPA: TetR/AcrR family transcriptional regulator [Gammaproteobacteria bacterium]|nr:TetR/AcrR family transcriptional regulator [Gammaproteobacteria bacterium]
MPRTSDPEKFQRLLGVTRQLLIRCGLSGASIDRICREAGISKGGFFHHFRTKEEAVSTAARHFVAELGRQFKNLPQARGNHHAGQGVLDYIDFTISACERSILSSGCLIGSLSTNLPEEDAAGIRRVCREAFNSWIASFENLLQAAQRAGLLPVRLDTQTLASQFVALVEGSLLLRNALGTDVLQRNLRGFREMLAQLMDARRKTRD